MLACLVFLSQVLEQRSCINVGAGVKFVLEAMLPVLTNSRCVKVNMGYFKEVFVNRLRRMPKGQLYASDVARANGGDRM